MEDFSILFYSERERKTFDLAPLCFQENQMVRHHGVSYMSKVSFVILARQFEL